MPLIIRLESSLFRRQRKLDAYNFRIKNYIIISHTVVSIILVWDSWGLFELNSQMAPILSQPFVSYRPRQYRVAHSKLRKNLQAMKILRTFLQKRRTRDRRTVRSPISHKSAYCFRRAFSRLWTSVIGI